MRNQTNTRKSAFAKLGFTRKPNNKSHSRPLRMEPLEDRRLLVVGSLGPNPAVSHEFEGVAQLDWPDSFSLSPVCTATLLPSGKHVLTAAHCVADENAEVFPGYDSLLVRFFTSSGEYEYDISSLDSITPHEDYDGIAGHGNDIAIIELSEVVDVAIPRYDIYRNNDELDKVFTRVGYGVSGSGSTGRDPLANPHFVRHFGSNRFEATGEDINGVPGLSSVVYGTDRLVYDFDNGVAANDALGTFFGETFEDLGLGNDEESMASRIDSGGPNFIGDQIAAVTSGSVTQFLTLGVGMPQPDIPTGPNGVIVTNESFGEIGHDTRVSMHADWIDDLIDIVGPQVTNVSISSSSSPHTYDFATATYGDPNTPGVQTDPVIGSGFQLATVPVGEADTVTLTFSEPVKVSEQDLELIGLRTANVPSLDDFTHTPGTNTASWKFTGLNFAGDQYLIQLADSVTDLSEVPLDGEWTNPGSLATVNSSVSEFPSGDETFGGDFEFVFTLMPGDANLDLVVDVSDLGILATNWMLSTTMFSEADFNGDGIVDVTDLGSLSTNWQENWSTLFLLGDLDGDFDVDADDLADGDLNGDGTATQEEIDLLMAQLGIDLEVVI